MTSGGSETATNDAMVPHKVVYKKPIIGSYGPLPNANSLLQHVPCTLLKQAPGYTTPQPTIIRAQLPESASKSRGGYGMEGFKEEMLEWFQQTFNVETKNRSYWRPYPDMLGILQDLKLQSSLNPVVMIIEVH